MQISISFVWSAAEMFHLDIKGVTISETARLSPLFLASKYEWQALPKSVAADDPSIPLTQLNWYFLAQYRMDSAEKSIGMSYICVWPAPPAHVLVVGQRPLPRPSLYLLSALEE